MMDPTINGQYDVAGVDEVFDQNVLMEESDLDTVIDDWSNVEALQFIELENEFIEGTSSVETGHLLDSDVTNLNNMDMSGNNGSTVSMFNITQNNGYLEESETSFNKIPCSSNFGGGSSNSVSSSSIKDKNEYSLKEETTNAPGEEFLEGNNSVVKGSGNPYCEKCKKPLTFMEGLKGYIYSCDCNIIYKVFSEKRRRKTLAKPLLTCKKIHPCLVCGKVFLSQCNFEKHIITHNRVEVLECNICSKVFKDKFTLVRHIHTHNHIKSHQCHICGKMFRRSAGLSDHLKYHEAGGQYKCGECGIEILHRSNFNRHLKSHKYERQFACDICGKSFRSKFHISRHMYVHIDLKPFKCQFCKKAFTQKSNLNIHMVVHTNAKNFKCTICDMNFGLKQTLTTHMMKKHSKDILVVK